MVKDKLTSKQVNPPNPTGRGGFKDNPQNISRDGRPKNRQRISWWMEEFLDMDEKDFLAWKSEGQPVAAVLAHTAVFNSRKDLMERKEVTDRTEGKPVSRTELTGKDGKDLPTPLLTGVIDVRNDDSSTETD